MTNAISNTWSNPLCPVPDIWTGNWKLLRRAFRQQLFQSPRLAVVGAVKRLATVSLSFFEESCAACSSLKLEDDIVIGVNRYFY